VAGEGTRCARSAGARLFGHRFLPEDQLRATFSEVLSADPGRVITYCGAAIAASSDAFVGSIRQS
jgi:hypothetical protein